MDRRNFLNMMGTASVLVPINALGISLNGFSEHESINQTALPRIRMILVGEASFECLAGLEYAHEDDSPIRNWHPQDILYLNADGKLEMYSAETNYSRPSLGADGWKACEQTLNNQAETIAAFKEAEPEIARFLQNCDWLLFVVTLDNPMAFVAGERIATIAKNAGVMSVAVVGMPYTLEIIEGKPSGYYNKTLRSASHIVVGKMAAICCCTIPDEGSWSGNGDDQHRSWSFLDSNMALCLVSKIAIRKDCCAQIGDAIASSGVCMVGMGYSEPNPAKAKIESAISESQYWLGHEMQLTSSGAIFNIIGNEDKAGQMKEELLLTLHEPSKILRNGKAFWPDDANFHIVMSSPEYMNDMDYCFIKVLSMGVAEV